jgi:hypothetical protein
VNLAFANHQDPDVSVNCGLPQKLNPDLPVVCSEDTWRLIRFYDLKPQALRPPVDAVQDLVLRLSTGHELRFVPTPFATSVRDDALDLQTRVLYTGDLLGGLSYVPASSPTSKAGRASRPSTRSTCPRTRRWPWRWPTSARSTPPRSCSPRSTAGRHGEGIPSFLERLRGCRWLNLLLDSQQRENYLAAMNELLWSWGARWAPPVAEALRSSAPTSRWPA